MALQDLTPQLRTRLNRMERAVGWFVTLAVLVLVFGFGYYLYTTAELKGWFLTKAPYFTYVDRATGLKVGDPVNLMGFNVGKITEIEGMPPWSDQNVFVKMEIKSPYYNYIWTEGSLAEITSSDFLGKRAIEVTKGTNGYCTYIFNPLAEMSIADARNLDELAKWQLAQELRVPGTTNLLFRPKTSLSRLNDIATAGFTNILVMDTRQERKSMTGIWNDRTARYDAYSSTNKYFLPPVESAAVTERLEGLVSKVEAALPDVLDLTNELANVLVNASDLTSNLNVTVLAARPIISNLVAATAGLDRPGALGQLLLSPSANRQLEGALTNANATLAAANTNLAILAENLNRSLDNLAGITSNLNHQVEVNTNLVSAISETIIHADQFIQGLKHHWLLRSAFKTHPTNSPTAAPPRPLRSPKTRTD
ncbi:MAG: hypothetical protein C5B50_24065 [Verrucomicrobia bacterium]|nr:MAG: hypothetical protein C5B50_24065 [Verrucomicrobiota bacterium]